MGVGRPAPTKPKGVEGMSQQLALFSTEEIEIPTPRNCYHCGWSDYSHYSRGTKSLICRLHKRKKVRKRQRACQNYRPMVDAAQRCNCTECQRLLRRLEE